MSDVDGSIPISLRRGETVEFAWGASTPIEMSFSIFGPNTLGWAPPGKALIQYWDPILQATVVKSIPIGSGYEATNISIVTGSLFEEGIGAVRITVIDNNEYILDGIPYVPEKLPLAIQSILKSASVVADAVAGVFTPTGYYVSDISSKLAVDFELSPGVTYDPTLLAKTQFNPNNLPIGYSPLFNSNGDFIGVTIDEEEMADERCFAAGTLIDMADGSQKPIETIEIGDDVLSYDPDADGGLGALRASKVTRTMTNVVDTIIDFHGVKVTPGHATLCTDGPDKGRHVPLMDIIMADGSVADRDGALIRAATNLVVGSEGDQFISVAYITNKSQQTYSNGKIRLGTLMLGQNGGEDWRIIDSLKREGYRIHDDGLISKDGEVPHPLYWFGNLPRPADYILAKSNLTLSDIYKGGTDTVVGLGELPMRAGMTVQ